ncbi:MAG: CehA/McbA family metallohydrolase [Bacteroidota bacterium]
MSNIKNSRRDFIKGLTATSVLSATSIPVIATSVMAMEHGSEESIEFQGLQVGEEGIRPDLYDGPQSPLFETIPLDGNRAFASMGESLSAEMANEIGHAPKGEGTAWGIPFHIPETAVLIRDEAFSMQITPVQANWLVFLHTSDVIDLKEEGEGVYRQPFKGEGQLNEEIADYIIMYSDGTEAGATIRERHQIGMFQRGWGENSVQSLAHHKPIPLRQHHEQITSGIYHEQVTVGRWGGSQTRVTSSDNFQWTNWLWAWENPHPDKIISGFRFEPNNKTSIVISAISAGMVRSNPLRWHSRQKAVFSIPDGQKFDPSLDRDGLLSQLQLDLGQVISAASRPLYPDKEWPESYNNQIPKISDHEVIIEYSAHPEARFHLDGGTMVPVSEAGSMPGTNQIKVVAPSDQKVRIRIVEKGSGKPVIVKLHVHGEAGEYLPPVDRHRIPNNAWFEDYSVDFVHTGKHICTYIPGETTLKLPVGKVYFEVSKGFEIKPVRKIVTITEDTEEVEIEIEKVLSWREKGWVSADTHVHFLSPNSALLEGSAEGVNIINLLASQWGELFTNVGDFDGTTTLGSREAGGDGEYLVRVGTENRQHVLGHISLLGYRGDMITPLTTGGPDESALGDPIEILLTEWAEQCKKQDGVVILPHFPNPRLENAATIVSGNAHGVEMTSWGSLYHGIDPYSLADWYRYLNCGYFVAAVGGTDKMSASTAVGTVRTYARISDNHEFTFDQWKASIKRGETFVSYGPLMNFTVDGKPMGSRIEMSKNGGTVDISWELASVTVPMSRVELIVNGEVTESLAIAPDMATGNWHVKVKKSSWCALLVRGHYPDKPEIITAHSSPVMIHVEGSPMLAAADAVTILEQIEGTIAYLETIGTRADEKTYKRMRLLLESTHRSVHNRMHQTGQYHRHTPPEDHPEHHS